MRCLIVYGGQNHKGEAIRVTNPTMDALDALIRKYGVHGVFEGCTLSEDETPVLSTQDGSQFTHRWAIKACGPDARTLIVLNRDNTTEAHVFRKGRDGKYAYSGGLQDADDHGQCTTLKETMKKIPEMRVQDGMAQFCRDAVRGDLHALHKAMQGNVGKVLWCILIPVLIAVVYFSMQNGKTNNALMMSVQMMENMNKEMKESKRETDARFDDVIREQMKTEKRVRDHEASLESARDLFADLKNDTKTLMHGQNKLAEVVNAQAEAQANHEHKVNKHILSTEERLIAVESKLKTLPGLMNGIEGPAPESTTLFGTCIGLYYTMVSLITNGLTLALIAAFLACCLMVCHRLATVCSLAVRLASKRMKAAKRC